VGKGRAEDRAVTVADSWIALARTAVIWSPQEVASRWKVPAYPFTDAQRRYISGNVVSLVDQARGHCDDGSLKYFDYELVHDGGRFFDVPTAMFTENEYVSVMTK
jgi:hypothetical protein